MKKTTLHIIAVTILTISAQAGKNVAPAPVEPIPVPVTAAPLGLFFGGGLTYAHSKCKCANLNLTGNQSEKTNKGNTYGFNIVTGYNFNNYIGLEGKYIYTPWGDDDKTLKHYGIYLKPSYPVNKNIDIYALLGYGKTECETLNETFKGFAWGAGVSYTFNKKVEGKKDGLGVYVEYLRPLKKTGNKNITIDMVNAGVTYNF